MGINTSFIIILVLWLLSGFSAFIHDIKNDKKVIKKECQFFKDCIKQIVSEFSE